MERPLQEYRDELLLVDCGAVEVILGVRGLYGESRGLLEERRVFRGAVSEELEHGGAAEERLRRRAHGRA